MSGDCLNVTIETVEPVIDCCEADLESGILRSELHLKTFPERITNNHEVAIKACSMPTEHAENRGREDAHEHPHLRFRQLDHPSIVAAAIPKI